MSDAVVFDVIVIGGGLAGLVSALLMSRTGKSVALLNTSTTMFKKVGGSTPASTNKLLEQLDLPLLQHPTHDSIAGSHSYWAGSYHQQDFMYHLQGCDWRLDRMQFESDLHHQAREDKVVFISDLLSNLHKKDRVWQLETEKNKSYKLTSLSTQAGEMAFYLIIYP